MEFWDWTVFIDEYSLFIIFPIWTKIEGINRIDEERKKERKKHRRKGRKKEMMNRCQQRILFNEGVHHAHATYEIAELYCTVKTMHKSWLISLVKKLEEGKLKYYMKSFIAKRVISILVNLRYLRFKLLKYKENNKKICNTFDHNFKNITLYIMSNVSLERYYFV